MEYRNEIMDKRYIEVNMIDATEEHERQMLLGIIIPSLLPLNVINCNDHSLLCYNTAGFISLADYEIKDIETLCRLIKGVVDAITLSEEHLLIGAKHFVDKDMVFVEPGSKEIRLIFGRVREENCCFGDNEIIIDFLNKFKTGMGDRVFIQLIDNIMTIIKQRNTRLKRINIIVDEIERKWYCKNMIQSLPFTKGEKTTYKM